MLWQWANNATQVFILDLDGTLMPSAEIDNQCFWQAVFERFGQQDDLPDLHGFQHVTDTGILQEWCTDKLGRCASPQEIDWVKQRFLQLLQTAAKRNPSHFMPLAGVEAWLQAVADHPKTFAAIATGGWGHSARLKLQLSGLDRFGLPLTSSDNAIARTEIMKIAARKLQALHGVKNSTISYIGDGTWDLLASQQLQWGFIGIATGDQAKQLSESGAKLVLTDFSHP